MKITNVDTLEQKFKTAERELNSMKRKSLSANVIAEQAKVVGAAQEAYERGRQIEEAAQKKLLEPITFKVVDKAAKQTYDVHKKVALVRNNRPIDMKKVLAFISLIENGQYEDAYPIIVAEAKQLVEAGYKVSNLHNEEVTAEESEDYYVVLDGQHRTLAFAKLIANEKDYYLPNIYVKDIDNVGAYLVSINETGTNWTSKDRMVVASLTTEGDLRELYENVANLIEKGYNPSTAMLVYTGKRMPASLINKALRGEEVTLPKGAEINIAGGNGFLKDCERVGISQKYLRKRYFIEGYISCSKAVGIDNADIMLDYLKPTEEELKAVKCGDDFVALLNAHTDRALKNF